MKKLLYVLPIIGLLFFTSCDKEESNEIIESSAKDTVDSVKGLYDFHKDIAFNSEQGSQGIMRIYSNSESTIEDYSSQHLKLVEIAESETLQQALVRQKIKEPNNTTKDEESDNKFNSEEASDSGIAFQLISVTKRNPNVRYAVSFYHPEKNTKVSWSYFTHYSGIGQTIATIDRHSALRRVYYGLKHKAYSTSVWSILRTEWTFLSNGNSFSIIRNPSYQFRMRVKTKSSSAYTVNFDN